MITSQDMSRRPRGHSSGSRRRTRHRSPSLSSSASWSSRSPSPRRSHHRRRTHSVPHPYPQPHYHGHPHAYHHQYTPPAHRYPTRSQTPPHPTHHTKQPTVEPQALADLFSNFLPTLGEVATLFVANNGLCPIPSDHRQGPGSKQASRPCRGEERACQKEASWCAKWKGVFFSYCILLQRHMEEKFRSATTSGKTRTAKRQTQQADRAEPNGSGIIGNHRCCAGMHCI